MVAAALVAGWASVSLAALFASPVHAGTKQQSKNDFCHPHPDNSGNE
jgi:hypothetical protein